jgi:hypothetical protein
VCKAEVNLAFGQCLKAPPIILPQASQGLGKSTMDVVKAKTLYKASAETTLQRRGELSEGRNLFNN